MKKHHDLKFNFRPTPNKIIQFLKNTKMKKYDLEPEKKKSPIWSLKKGKVRFGA